MSPTDKQLRFLRGKAHALKPIIQIGQHGLTPGVAAETQRALADHELIKVRLQGMERESRDALVELLTQATKSTLVTRIGHVAVLFRAKPGKSTARIVLPDP